MNIDEYQKNYEFEESYWWFLGMQKVYLALLDMVLPERTNISILDVGCGTGSMLECLQRYGTVIGLDVSQIALDFCRQRPHKLLVRASVENLPFAAESFDLITALGLVEHVEDDAKVLDELYRVCKPGGYVLALTSAYMFLWSHHDVANQHLRRYTVGEFKDLCEKAKFEVRKISYINTFLFPLILLVRMTQKLTGIDEHIQGRDLIKMPSFVNSALTGFLGIEASLVKKFNLPFGVGLICLAQKP